jgi:sorbitol-specific phosphotransferase system component IIBC
LEIINGAKKRIEGTQFKHLSQVKLSVVDGVFRVGLYEMQQITTLNITAAAH